MLTDSELQRYRAASSLMDALQTMRPVWLTSAGRLPQVSVDGAKPANFESLAYVPVHAVVDIALRRLASVGRVQTTPAGAMVVTGDLLLIRTR